MNGYHLCIARAEKLEFSRLYRLEGHQVFAFDITFENPSTPHLPNMQSIRAGFCEDDADWFMECVKKHFQKVGISADKPVAVLFSNGQILAISPIEEDLWIDVRKGINPSSHPLSFQALDIHIKSLEVY